MKHTIVLVLFTFTLLFSCDPLPARDSLIFYIDAQSGNDSGSGTTLSSAWKTIDRLAQEELVSGDTILLKRGGEYRGQIIPYSGSNAKPITYSAYGTGEKPVIMGSINKSLVGNWILDTSKANVYHCDQTSQYDIGNIIFNHEASVALKKWSLAELTNQGDYWYETSTGILHLYSSINPGTFYTDIECAIDKFIINESDRSNVIYENLSLKYGAANGIGGGNTFNITIRNCDFSYIGGAYLYTNASNEKIRYGNAVEFQRNAHDNIVENCTFTETFDTAVTNQSNKTAVAQYNIYYRNNVIRNSGMASVEIWVRDSGSSLHDIYFENNTCYNAGGGWSATQNRPSPVGLGHHVTSFGSDCLPKNIYIRNNIFHTSINPTSSYASGILIQPIGSQTNAQANFNFTSNCYYNIGENIAVFLPPTNVPLYYAASNFSAYQAGTGQDSQSFIADPVFTNIGANNYHIEASSPCRNTGVTLLSNKDFEGNSRPLGSAFDIGAYEYVE